MFEQEDNGPPGEDGPVLGSLRLPVHPANATDSSGTAPIVLTLSNPQTADLPEEYQMRTTRNSGPAMLVFSEQEGKVASKGVVVYRLDAEAKAKQTARGGTEVRLTGDPAYRKLSRERHEAAATKGRIQVITETSITDLRRPLGAEPVSTKRKAEEKRTAMERDDLQQALFKLFERQARWAFVQIQRQTDQPTQHLKAVLSEIAVQNKAGPYRDLWELRREFRTGGN